MRESGNHGIFKTTLFKLPIAENQQIGKSHSGMIDIFRVYGIKERLRTGSES